MKPRLTYILALFLAASCSSLKDETNTQNEEVRNGINNIDKQIEDLYLLRDEVNSNISAMKIIMNALENTDFVTAAEPIISESKTIGYRISFSKSGQIEIYSGKDGSSPVINLKKDSDGEWYWTLNGEWLFSADGKKVRANGKDGVTPLLRISAANWEISYDNGATWTILGRAQGYSIGYNFKSVSINDGKVTFTTVNDDIFSFPFYKKSSISFEVDGETAGAAAGKTLYIPYSISSDCKSPVLIASSDGYYTVKIEKKDEYSGHLVVKCPETYKNGYIFTTVIDGNGYSFVNIIRFTEEKIVFSEGMHYKIDEGGGSINIPFQANFKYTIKVSDEAQSWLSARDAETRTDMTPHNLTVTAGKNESSSSRNGVINLFSLMNPYEPFCSIVVTQSSSTFSIDRTECSFTFSGGSESIGIFSTENIVGDVDSDWLDAEIEYIGNCRYELIVKAQSNTLNEPRMGTATIINADSRLILGTITIKQDANPYDPDDMVFSVRPRYGNDFSVCLPLYGNLDCKIDWGDGTIENVRGSYDRFISHTYDISSPRDYDVRISGKVYALNSINIPLHSVKEIKQWGNVGLKDMSRAFANNPHITRLPGDTRGAFSSVTTFLFAFDDCINLSEIDTELFSFAGKATDFSSCFTRTKLIEVSRDLLKKCISMENCSAMFYGCSRLQSVPDSLFAYCVNMKDVGGVFSDCDNIEEVPGNIFANCSEIISAGSAFSSCDKLKKVGTSLFDSSRKIQDFGCCFDGDKLLQGESPFSVINGKKIHLYERHDYSDYFVNPVRFVRCFLDATQLTDYENIPLNWK